MLVHKIQHVARKFNNSLFICIKEFHQSPCLAISRVNKKSRCQTGGSGGETMEAIVFNPQDKSVKFVKDHPKPQITGPEDVQIKVAFAGVCGTDLHIMKGEFPVKEDGPLILGHELCGVVTDVGKQCTMFKKGQNVVVDPCRICSLCKPCRLGLYQFCSTNPSIGLFRDGGYAQYCIVPQQQVFALPDTITLEQGILCEPYSCVWHTIDRLAPVHIGQKILVIGAGIIGILFTTVLHKQGHNTVTVTERNVTRLNFIKNLDTCFRLIDSESLDKEKPLFDVIIDCTGNGKVFDKAVHYLNFGGRYVIFGCAPPTHRSTFTPFVVFDKELKIMGFRVNPFSFPHALGLLTAMGDRYFDYKKLGIEKFTLSELPKGIEKLKKGLISKAMLIPNGSKNKC